MYDRRGEWFDDYVGMYVYMLVVCMYVLSNMKEIISVDKYLSLASKHLTRSWPISSCRRCDEIVRISYATNTRLALPMR